MILFSLYFFFPRRAKKEVQKAKTDS